VPADAVDLRVAYYAPHLRCEIGQSLAGDLPLPPRIAEAVQRWAETLGAPVEVAQGYLTQPLQQIAEWVAARFGLDARLVRWFVATFLTEVDACLHAAGPGRGSNALRVGVRAASVHMSRRGGG